VQRYHRLCEQLRIGSQYYRIEQSTDSSEISFRKDPYQTAKSEVLFGKNIIVTDNSDWTTEDIVQASLDRWGVEKAFRDTKSSRHISTHPMYHWTDNKIRCHLLTCIIALTMQRLLELIIEPSLGTMSADKIIEAMRELRSVIVWYPKKKKPQHQLEEPTLIQKEVLKAFGYEVNENWVLQKINP
jgi:transposase